MEDFRIKDSQITTSSALNGTTAYGWQARLNQNIGDCTGAGRTIIEGANIQIFVFTDCKTIDFKGS